MSPFRKRDSVELHVTGHRAILKRSFSGRARWNETWFQFLARCGVKLTPQDGVYVRTLPTNKRKEKDWGWNAELDEPVGTFLSKFERLKQTHSVRLMLRTLVPVNSSTSTRAQSVKAGRRTPAVDQSSTKNANATRRRARTISSESNVIYRRPRYTPGFAHTSKRPYGTRLRSKIDQNAANLQQCSRPINSENVRKQNTDAESDERGGPYNNDNHNENSLAIIEPDEPGPSTLRITSVRSLQPVIKIERPQISLEMDMEEELMGGGLEGEREAFSEGNNDELGTNESFENDDARGGMCTDEDNLSLRTGVPAKARELRQQRIQVEDVKSLAGRRMTRFSNAFMLRVKAEIKKLRENSLWDRNVTRCPLACYMLQEMFKDNLETV